MEINVLDKIQSFLIECKSEDIKQEPQTKYVQRPIYYYN